MPEIAILTSTSPLRKTSTRHGRTKQRLNFQVCGELATRFDVIIVGSIAADEVFAHVSRNLPKSMRTKFRFYNRSFFHTFLSTGRDGAAIHGDPRDDGWQAILTENQVAFEPIKGRLTGAQKSKSNKFHWRRMGEFITDPRVVLVTGSEGQLFYETPPGAAGKH